jgi:hypothetical protein
MAAWATFDRVTKILIVLLVGVCLLPIGIAWSRSSPSGSNSGFDQGWLLVALAVFQSLKSRPFAGKVPRRRKWRRIIPALATGLPLEALSDHFFLRIGDQQSARETINFALFRSLFLVNIVVWTALFTDDEQLDQVFETDERPRVRSVRAIAILVVAICVCGTVWCFRSAGSGILNVDSALQQWFYWAALLVYGFMVLAALWPLLEIHLRQPRRLS